ncbi:putative transcription factor e(y)2 [Lyophyllum shimeji]|uniref:Transcription and mRNA export factor SUS1 n=1 Tax=Lyophyllum shimeji TaxID=47721 RepID=A0A9P3PXI2_LYOSH|nr:putative transcription factor e(y)2 [Lyophyllum shimeji]
MPVKPAEVDALHAQIHRRLVNSGEWDRILSNLASKLNESGWSDDLLHRSKERARVMEPLSFQALFDEFAPNAQGSLPLAIKREIMAQIREYVEKQFA